MKEMTDYITKYKTLKDFPNFDGNMPAAKSEGSDVESEEVF